MASSEQTLESTRFWMLNVFIPIFVCIGITGNVVTVIILTRKRMRSSTNIYLTALAIADIVYLLCAFYLTFMNSKHISEVRYEMYWRFFGLCQWLVNAASNTSVWLTVSFTIERYVAVCHPIKGKAFCTENRAKCVIVIVSLLCITTTVSTAFEFLLDMNDECLEHCIQPNMTTPLPKSHAESLMRRNTTNNHFISDSRNIIMSNIPAESEDGVRLVNDIYRTLQPDINEILPANCSTHPHIIYLKIEPAFILNRSRINERNLNDSYDDDESSSLYDSDGSVTHYFFLNQSDLSCCVKTVKITLNDTELGANETYKAIRNWYYTIFFALLPFVLIATFNAFLVHAVYKSQANRRTLTNRRESSSMSNENRITVMLISVVCLFLICQTPSATMLIYENLYGTPQDKDGRNMILVLNNIMNFLVTVNDAMNFVMYCVLSKKYRDTFRLFFCTRPRKPNRQDTMVMSLTASTGGSRNERTPTANNTGPPRILRNNQQGSAAPRHLEEMPLKTRLPPNNGQVGMNMQPKVTKTIDEMKSVTPKT